MSEEIVVGSVSVEVVPTARGFAAKLDAQVSPEARAVGKQIGERLGRDISAPIAPAVRDALRDGSRSANEQGRKSGSEFAGSFASTAKTRLEAAFKALPKAHVGTDATELDAELVAIRAKIAGLRDIHIGVDLDAGAALVEIENIKLRVAQLAARSPHIDVKVDAARALAELAAVRAAVDALGAWPTFNVGTGGLSGVASLVEGLVGSISATTVAVGALLLALIPVAAVLGGIVASAVLLAAVLGGAVIASVIGLVPIVKTLQAMSAADKESAQSATSAATARINAAESVRSATASLANAVQSADSAAIRSAQAVINARRGVADAQRSATRAIESALGAQASAEGTLAAAQRAARSAVQALTQARKDAQQQIEDLARATKGAALDERQGVLSIEEARKRLQDVNANPLSSATERRQARLDYDQAVQNLDDIRARNKALASTKAQADAAGVKGAAGVLAAQQAVADATARVAAAQAAVLKSARDLAEARRAGAESVVRAEEQVTSALRAQRDQARQSAFAIVQAQAAVAAASRQQVTATAAIGSAAAKAKKDLAALSPTGRLFVTFLHDEFLPALGKVTRAATDGLASGFMRGLQALVPILPVIATDMGRFAKAAGDLFAAGAIGLASPFWVQFFDFLSKMAGPALAGTGQVLGNIAKGLAGLLEAFAPFAKVLGGGIERLAKKFADFGTSAGKGGALDKFLKFLEEKGPGIARDLGSVARAFGDIVVAAAPLGVRILDALGKFGDFIHAIKPLLKPVIETLYLASSPIVALADAFIGLKNTFKSVFNFIADAWNKMHFHIPGFDLGFPGAPHFGGIDVGVGHIDRLALGGIVTAPTLALIGEGRESEAVMPLSFLSHLLAEQSGLGQQRSSFGATGAKAPVVIEHFEQKNYHPAMAYTSPREEMMRLQHALNGL